MKRFLSSFAILVVALNASGQSLDPVKWTFATAKKTDKIYDVVITATFPKPWHIYSQATPPGGPIPTSFSFKTNPLVVLDGKMREDGKLEIVHDENFDVDVEYYSVKVVFTQTVKLKSPVKTNVAGTLEYMVCNDTKCHPPKKLPFNIQLQ